MKNAREALFYILLGAGCLAFVYLLFLALTNTGATP